MWQPEPWRRQTPQSRPEPRRAVDEAAGAEVVEAPVAEEWLDAVVLADSGLEGWREVVAERQGPRDGLVSPVRSVPAGQPVRPAQSQRRW
jgi:hypothetical protein